MTGLKLYEIDSELARVEDALHEYAQEHMGDVTDFPYDKYYQVLTGERNEKLLNLGSWYKSLKAESGAYIDELKTLQHKKKVIENKMKWVQGFIQSYIKKSEKLKDTRVALSWRKSESVEVDEDKFLMNNLGVYFRITTETIDKAKVKTALKTGKTFVGISLLEKQNLQIK